MDSLLEIPGNSEAISFVTQSLAAMLTGRKKIGLLRGLVSLSYLRLFFYRKNYFWIKCSYLVKLFLNDSPDNYCQ